MKEIPNVNNGINVLNLPTRRLRALARAFASARQGASESAPARASQTSRAR